MDWCGTQWLLLLLLITHPNCAALPGLPVSPAIPRCHIPYGEYDRAIHCALEGGTEFLSENRVNAPVNYTLHWESAHGRGQVEVTNGTGLILRDHMSSHSELHVWVQALNQYGSTSSERASFNTADILMPPTPEVTGHSHDPLEIYWVSRCSLLALTEGRCEVQHRLEGDQASSQVVIAYFGMYLIKDPQPFTVYEFQVRCSCSGPGGLQSDWSAIYKVQSAEAAPVGELDVWKDCGITSEESKCVLMWKRLPRARAAGIILGYEVVLFYDDGLRKTVNVSMAESREQLLCDEKLCRLLTSLNHVLAVNVTAYNALGATKPAALTAPRSDAVKDEPAVHLNLTENNLDLSWDPSFQPTRSLKEYLVEYKEAGSAASIGFDWIRVNKNHTSATLKGHFQNHTAYQVSLFAIFQSGCSHQKLATTIGFILQGIPPKVSSFSVESITAAHATLFWESIPLSRSKGLITFYQIDMDNHKVYNVTASPHQKNMTLQLVGLKPSQEFIVGIRAFTEVGPGPEAKTSFKTIDDKEFSGLFVFFFVVTTPLMGIAVILIRLNKECCSFLPLCREKVPDPQNSRLFSQQSQMKWQFIDSSAWNLHMNPEPNPEIMQVEVMENQPPGFDGNSTKAAQFTEDKSERSLQPDSEGGGDRDNIWMHERTGPGSGSHRQEYSQMLDSDEEGNGEESKSDSSSVLEDKCFSGYETHFMPHNSDL